MNKFILIGNNLINIPNLLRAKITNKSSYTIFWKHIQLKKKITEAANIYFGVNFTKHIYIYMMRISFIKFNSICYIKKMPIKQCRKKIMIYM